MMETPCKSHHCVEKYIEYAVTGPLPHWKSYALFKTFETNGKTAIPRSAFVAYLCSDR